MIVTIGGISVGLVFPDEGTGARPVKITDIPEGALGRFIARGEKGTITLAVRRVPNAPWSRILIPEDLERVRRAVRTIEERFPFTRVRFETDTDETPPPGAGSTRVGLLSSFSDEVSIIPHPGFLLAFDHRRLRGEAVIKADGDEDFSSSLLPVLQGVLSLAAPDFGALMLHAASLVLDGAGYLFVGSSGAGKSTIAALGGPGTVLSDDGSWCRRENREFSLSATPFSQSDADFDAEVLIPLRGVFFLEKGVGDRTVDIEPGRAVVMLLSNHIHFFRFMRRETAAAAFGLVNELCRAIPVSTLFFTRFFNPESFFGGKSHERKKTV